VNLCALKAISGLSWEESMETLQSYSSIRILCCHQLSRFSTMGPDERRLLSSLAINTSPMFFATSKYYSR